MARVIKALVYLTSDKRVWTAESVLPWARHAAHRAKIIEDYWRDVEGGIAALHPDGEVDVGFYLEVIEDRSVHYDSAVWNAWIAGQIRPDHLTWIKLQREDLISGKAVLP